MYKLHAILIFRYGDLYSCRANLYSLQEGCTKRKKSSFSRFAGFLRHIVKCPDARFQSAGDMTMMNLNPRDIW